MTDGSVKRKVQGLMLLLTAVLVCDVVLVVMTPAMVLLGAESVTGGAVNYLGHLLHPGEDDIVAAGVMGVFLSWLAVWGSGVWAAVRAAALVVLGGSAAHVLRQAIGLLGNVEEGDLFTLGNEVALRRSARGCFIGTAAGLARLLEVALRRGLGPEDVFLPLLLLGGGLFCAVLAVLFRQVVELKAENDLTI